MASEGKLDPQNFASSSAAAAGSPLPAAYLNEKSVPFGATPLPKPTASPFAVALAAETVSISEISVGDDSYDARARHFSVDLSVPLHAEGVEEVELARAAALEN
jgi:hypothetical protein